ncbi:hypothetical protein JCM5353_005050 [Sporobolomyces roseus]
MCVCGHSNPSFQRLLLRRLSSHSVSEHVQNIESKILRPLRTPRSSGLLSFSRSHSSRCQTSQHSHRSYSAKAEFYHPGQELNVRVASKSYKGPELLVDYGFYDYSPNLWSVGCTFRSMIFRRDPLFHGSDSYVQFIKITKVLGIEEVFQYLEKEIDPDPIFDFDEGKRQLVNYPRKAWSKFVNAENQRYISDEAIDLVDRLLTYDHVEQPTAKEAMEHPYIHQVRQADLQRKFEFEAIQSGHSRRSTAAEPETATFLSTSEDGDRDARAGEVPT